MYTDIFYHEKLQLAYAILPGCDDIDTLTMEIKLLEEHLKLEKIIQFEHRRIGEGPYWGNSVLKFRMHPSVYYAHKSTFYLIDKENVGQIRPEAFKQVAERI